MTQPGVGKWTRDEHLRYLQAIKMYPQGPWQTVANYVGTRSARQTQTHAQKYREKVSRRKRGLLRKRAMSDEWLETHSSGDDNTSTAAMFHGGKYQHALTSLPALSALAEPTVHHQQPVKTYYESFPVTRLPALEPLHPPGGYATDKSFPSTGSFQSSLAFSPSTSHQHHQHHHHQQQQQHHHHQPYQHQQHHQSPPQHHFNPSSYGQSSFRSEYKQEYVPHHHQTHHHHMPSTAPVSFATNTSPSNMADYHQGSSGNFRGAPPPLDDLMQLFVDGEFMAHQRNPPI